MSKSTIIFMSLLALTAGYLTQQPIETLFNTALTIIPFNIKTVS